MNNQTEADFVDFNDLTLVPVSAEVETTVEEDCAADGYDGGFSLLASELPVSRPDKSRTEYPQFTFG